MYASFHNDKVSHKHNKHFNDHLELTFVVIGEWIYSVSSSRSSLKRVKIEELHLNIFQLINAPSICVYSIG